MNGLNWTLTVAATLVMASCATAPRPRCPELGDPGDGVVRPLEPEEEELPPSPLEDELLAKVQADEDKDENRDEAEDENEDEDPDEAQEASASALVGELHVLAWATMRVEGSEGGVVVARREGGHPVVVARRELPGLDEAHPSEEIELALSARDLDGDGRLDLLVRYEYGTEPGPGVGGDRHDRLAIFALPDLAPKWEGEINLSPGGSYLRRCEGEVGFAVTKCNGHSDLVLKQTCGDGVCFDEPESWDADARKDCAQPGSRLETRVKRYRWSHGAWR